MTFQNKSTAADSLNPPSLFGTSGFAAVQTRSRDRTFNIGTRSSFERSGQLRGRDRRDSFRFELRRSSIVLISVRNRDLFFSSTIRIRLERRGSSSSINRTASPGGLALIDRRLSSGTYTLRLSSREEVRYRLVYRRRSDRVNLFS